jgi:membrane fusion protein, heavy metal efflux system
MRTKLLLFCFIAILTACSNDTKIKENDSASKSDKEVVLPENSNITQKLQIQSVSAEPYQVKLSTFGIVQAIPNNYAKIAAPFAGRITKSFVKLGQKVSANAPIFEISSPSFFEAGKTYYRAKQELALAGKNLSRQKDLLKNGVGVQKELEETETNYELSKREYENAVASLKVFNVNPEELVLGQPLIVRSPIAGEIVENKIVIGQYLKEDAEPIACVAELSKVWIVGQLKEKDIKSVHESDEAEVILSGMPDEPIKGKIYHISEMLDEETRSAKVFIECVNSHRFIKPGMYVTVRFIKNPEKAILIPTTSVFQKEKNSFVFVHAGKNKFVRRNIEIVGTDNDKVILKSGLAPNEEIVTNGGIYLLEVND